MKSGWEHKPLESIAALVMGQAPASKDCNKDGIGTPFVKAGEFGKFRPIIREWTTDPKKIAKSTDVLICVVGATCGKLNLGADCAIGRSAAAIRPSPDKLDQFYLHYFMQQKVLELRKGSEGAAQTVISKKMLNPMLIPLPPLEEQKRIVAILDEAFEGLDRARAHTEANLQNAKELFESYSTDKLKAGNQNSNINDVADVQSGFAFKSRGYVNDEDGIRLVRGDNIIQGKFRWEKVKKWPLAEFDDFERYKLQINDVLLAMDRTWVKAGIKYTIVGEDDVPSLLVQRVARLRAKANITYDYLSHLIGSKYFEEYVLSIQTGLGVPHISGQQIKDFSFFLPELKIQERVASDLTAFRNSSIKMQKAYLSKLKNLEGLRQSLLQKAFAGELS